MELDVKTEDFRPFKYAEDAVLLNELETIGHSLNALFKELSHRQFRVHIDSMDARQAEDCSVYGYIPYVNIHIYKHVGKSVGDGQLGKA